MNKKLFYGGESDNCVNVRVEIMLVRKCVLSFVQNNVSGFSSEIKFSLHAGVVLSWVLVCIVVQVVGIYNVEIDQRIFYKNSIIEIVEKGY